MKKISFHVKNLVERKPVWIALSDLYLDTELQDYHYDSIARIILDSPYSLEEVKAIDKYEVFPILRSNLMSTFGVWSGFKEDYLVSEISKYLATDKFYTHFITNISYFFLQKMTKESWDKIGVAYQKLKP